MHTRFTSLALTLLTFTLPIQSASADWTERTVLVSPLGAETVVRHPDNDTILFKNTDPQLAIEWGMANARNTVVLAGNYVVSDRIDVPRDGVTLIIDQGAEISPKPGVEFTSPTPGFRGRNGQYYPFGVLIYNQKNNVRVLMLGTVKTKGFPVMFDGRNERGDCGLEGGMLLGTGQATDTYWLVDSRNVQVPIATLNTGTGSTVAMEGCEDCHLGMLANLAAEPGGMTEETIDLNSRCFNITIDQLLGERANEIIDCNESHAVVQELVSIGEPRKLLARGNPSGPRFTSRKSFNTRSLDVKTITILKDAVSSRLIHDIPAFPQALPEFTIKTTVEVTLEDGRKKLYEKAVAIDLREK
ncbi:hypothetical protein N8525_04110 [Verrucomicrobiales bacterium]|nr:hypothetical protein [Verrucomicrobiales bacterium]